MKTENILGKFLAGTANLLNEHSKTQKLSIVVFENGKVTEVIA